MTSALVTLCALATLILPGALGMALRALARDWQRWADFKYNAATEAFRTARNLMIAFLDQGKGDQGADAVAAYEYATTIGDLNKIPADDPIPPPGSGWQLVTVTHVGERNYGVVWTWERPQPASASTAPSDPQEAP